MEFKGSLRGRDKKYDFSTLTVDGHIKIKPVGNVEKHRHQVSCAIYQWKKNNGIKWVTPVRIVNDFIVVFRVS